MLVFKIILLIIAIFSTVQYLNNILSDINDVKMASSIYITPDEKKNSIDRGYKMAKARIVLSSIMSVSWALFIML